MKSYTDIEQSKKLAEILPLESADMCFANDGTSIKIDANPYNARKYMWKDVQLIPCWSLAALLDVLPNKLCLVLAINDFQGDRKEKYVIGSVEHDKYDCYADNPIDACVAMIEKLHELKIL